jgi:hypothetical protein
MSRESRPITLKITVSEEPERMTMKLEGRIVGPWVHELERAWRSLLASLGAKKLRVDLCGIDHIAPDGRQVLAEIYNTTGADFLADTPMTKYFADEAQLQNPKGSKGGG